MRVRLARDAHRLAMEYAELEQRAVAEVIADIIRAHAKAHPPKKRVQSRRVARR